MTPDVSQWRSTERYDYVEQLVSPELAWEWLRRNEAYQRDYADVVETAGASRPLNEAAQQRWGLRFPGSPIVRRQAGRAVLDSEGRYRRGHPDRDAPRTVIGRRRITH